MKKKSLKQVLDENEDMIDLDDGVSFEDSWDMSASIMVTQDFRSGGATKLADRLHRVMTNEQWAQFVFDTQDKVRPPKEEKPCT